MDNVRTMQRLIATQDAVFVQTGPRKADVGVNWFGTSAPLIVPDKVRGEWRLQTSTQHNGEWRLRYVYHAPKTQWCIMVKTCDGCIELEDSRSWDYTATRGAMMYLNLGLKDTQDRFRVMEVPT